MLLVNGDMCGAVQKTVEAFKGYAPDEQHRLGVFSHTEEGEGGEAFVESLTAEEHLWAIRQLDVFGLLRSMMLDQLEEGVDRKHAEDRFVDLVLLWLDRHRANPEESIERLRPLIRKEVKYQLSFIE